MLWVVRVRGEFVGLPKGYTLKFAFWLGRNFEVSFWVFRIICWPLGGSSHLKLVIKSFLD